MTKEIGSAPLMSIDDLDLVAASGKVHKFAYKCPKRGDVGVILHIVGDEAASVQAFSNELGNDIRRRNARRAADAIEAVTATGEKPEPVFTPVEDDLALMYRQAAARLVGWEGLSDPMTPENALRLVTVNRAVREQVREQAEKLANFI